MNYKLKNGATLEGTPDQILAVAKSLGEKVDLAKLGVVTRGHYKSSSKGIIPISSMETGHIRNALLKYSKTYFENLADKSLSNSDFLDRYVAIGDEPMVVDLYAELSKRK